MKKIFLAFLSTLIFSASANAQYEQTPRLNNGYKTFPEQYFGFRIGADFSSVSSDNKYLGCDTKAGLNVAFTYGIGLTYAAPLFLETGFAYTEKGGKSTKQGTKYSYNLDYLELPFVVKYSYSTNLDIDIHPFLGGYFAYGIGGKIKDYNKRESYDSFSDEPISFRRFDAGLKFGCGISYELIYAEIAYELGLANTSHDEFDTAHNRALMLNFGVNF